MIAQPVGKCNGGIMKILVTGGSGFVGRNLTERLIRDGHEVTITSTGTEPMIPGVKKIVYMGLEGIDWSQAEDKDAVIHLMANNDTRCIDEKEMIRANYQGSIRLFEVAYKSGCRKFIYASSTAVYGNSPAPYIEDETPEEPLNVYGESKRMFDDYIRQIPTSHEVQTVGFRYCNIYGPGEDQKGKRMSMIGQMIRKLLKVEKPKLFKWGEQKRDWVHVQDVVEANILALHSDKSGIYNIGSGVASTFNEITDILQHYFGELAIPEYIDCPFESEYQNHTECCIEKARRELGFSPGFDLRSGIEDYIRTFSERIG
jgi:ADP-L-glycero-D-manno-heptose 6-epimerase